MMGRFWRRLVVALWSVGLVGMLLAMGVGRMLPRGGELMYRTRNTRFGDGESQLNVYLLDIDHVLTLPLIKNIRRLEFVLSPEGNRIAFIRSEADYTHLVIMDADGKNARSYYEYKGLSLGLDPRPIAWSSDSNRLLFQTPVDNQIKLAVLDVTSNQVVMLDFVDPTYYATWSSDGLRIILYIPTQLVPSLYAQTKAVMLNLRSLWSGCISKCHLSYRLTGNISFRWNAMIMGIANHVLWLHFYAVMCMDADALSVQNHRKYLCPDTTTAVLYLFGPLPKIGLLLFSWQMVSLPLRLLI